MNIGHIRDETNVAAPYRGPRIEVPPLSENLEDMVDLDQRDYPTILEHEDPTPTFSSHSACKAPALLDPCHHLRH